MKDNRELCILFWIKVNSEISWKRLKFCSSRVKRQPVAGRLVSASVFMKAEALVLCLFAVRSDKTFFWHLKLTFWMNRGFPRHIEVNVQFARSAKKYQSPNSSQTKFMALGYPGIIASFWELWRSQSAPEDLVRSGTQTYVIIISNHWSMNSSINRGEIISFFLRTYT